VLDVPNAEAIMDLDTLIVTVFCLLDDPLVVALVGLPVRQRAGRYRCFQTRKC
jgi:hypothetical protein